MKKKKECYWKYCETEVGENHQISTVFSFGLLMSRVLWCICASVWHIVLFWHFDWYLLITTLIHEERLGVCDQEMTQIVQFAKMMYGIKYKNCRTWSVFMLICCRKDSRIFFQLILWLQCLVCKICIAFKLKEQKSKNAE